MLNYIVEKIKTIDEVQEQTESVKKTFKMIDEHYDLKNALIEKKEQVDPSKLRRAVPLFLA